MQEVLFQSEMEHEISRQLQRQATGYADHLRASLEKQASEIGQQYRALIQAALKDQREEYQEGYHRLAGSMQVSQFAIVYFSDGFRPLTEMETLPKLEKSDFCPPPRDISGFTNL